MSVLTAPADAPQTALLTHSQEDGGSVPATFLALDPGVTTGWCLARWVPNENRILLACGEKQFALLDLYVALWSLANETDCTVIYETFEYRNRSRTGLNLTPVKMIGVIELAGQMFNEIGLCSQNAAQGKGFWNDDKLRKYKVYKTGRKHGRDATRHMLHFFTFGAGVQYIGDIDKIEIDLVDIEWLATAFYHNWSP